MKKIVVTNPKAMEFFEHIKRKKEELHKKMEARMNKRVEEIKQELKNNDYGK